MKRWDMWYSNDNLRKDKRILVAPPSQCAENAAKEFLTRGKRRILDLACGVGRDTFHLEKRGLSVIGVDASWNGLRAAQQVKLARGVVTEFVTADARYLPFENTSFEGIYCFGLLHEFTSDDKEENVTLVISEVKRLLHDNGIFALTVLSGEAEDGLPEVQLFTRQMLEHAMAGWHPLEVKMYDDVGCTNRADYHVWYGLYEK